MDHLKPQAPIPPKLREMSHTLAKMFIANRHANWEILTNCVGQLIKETQELEALACHEIGQASKEKEPLLCSQDSADSSPPSSLPSPSPS